MNSGGKASASTKLPVLVSPYLEGTHFFTEISVTEKNILAEEFHQAVLSTLTTTRHIKLSCREVATVKNAIQCIKNRKKPTGDMPGYI